MNQHTECYKNELKTMPAKCILQKCTYKLSNKKNVIKKKKTMEA
jgi:hypothetical protein